MVNVARERAETYFQRQERLSASVQVALAEEKAHHDKVVANMRRLRSLRLARDNANGIASTSLPYKEDSMA